jgi:hypothetical protein
MKEEPEEFSDYSAMSIMVIIYTILRRWYEETYSKDGYSPKKNLILNIIFNSLYLLQLVYRVIIFFICLALLIFGLFTEQGGYSSYFLYFHNFVHIQNTIFWLLSCITVLVHIFRNILVFITKKPANYFIFRIMVSFIEPARQAAFVTSFVSTSASFFFYWIYVYSIKPSLYSYILIPINGGTLLLLIIEFFISTVQVSLPMILSCYLSLLGYLLFMVVNYYVQNFWIYPIFDPTKIELYKLILLYIGMGLYYLIVFFMLYFASLIRNLVAGMIKRYIFRERDAGDFNYKICCFIPLPNKRKIDNFIHVTFCKKRNDRSEEMIDILN